MATGPTTTSSQPSAGSDQAGHRHGPGPSRRRRVSGPLLLAGAVLLASLALHLRDPHQQGSWGLCPWLLLTGTYCPGCGGLRAVNDLTHGRVLDATSSNLLVVAAIPAAAALWVRSFTQRWRGVRHPWPARRVNVAWGLSAAVVLVFWVVRNLPLDAVHWLTP